jgi:hypothetical protein
MQYAFEGKVDGGDGATTEKNALDADPTNSVADKSDPTLLSTVALGLYVLFAPGDKFHL